MGSNPPGSVTSKSDPPSGGTSTAPAASSATPTATAGSLSGTSYSTITGTLNGSNSCNCGTPAFALVSQPAHGTLTLTNAAKGTFSYTPEPGFAGTDSFTFDLGNGQATSATATETLTISPTAIGAETVPANIGAVLDGITYYSITQPYVDMMRATGNGGGQTWVGAGASAGVGDLAKAGLLDTNGWPEVDAAVLVAVGANADGSKADPGIGSVLFGKYQLSFQGIASIGDDGGKVENQNYDPATDTTTATLDQTPLHSDGSGFDMLLSFTKTQRTASSATNTGITDVHVIRPQFAPNGAKWWDSPTQEFTDPFLASLAPFSTLRFMDWTATNGSQVANWDQRTPADWVGGHEIETDSAWEWNGTDHKTEPTDNWWSPTGQSWQSVIDLANATGKDIWINIPIRATDDYVTSLATLLKNGLDPGIHVYVEYSNEVWNGSFEQWFYNDAATKQLLATDTTEAANYQKNCTSNSICHEAERLMQISNDFASVWGRPAINAAIRPVFCNQEVGPGSMQTALDFINNTYGPPAKYFYGICSAPYWNPASVSAGESVDNLLAASAASIPKWDGYLLAWTATARYYGLHNFTYEGGPSMTDRNQIDLPNMLAANADPRMGQEVTQALTGAFQDGVDMYMYFTSSGAWSQYGMWGATDDILDLTQPKWQALQALAGKPITRTLAVTAASSGYPAGTTLPGTIPVNPPTFTVTNDSIETQPWIVMNCGTPAVCALKGTATPGTGFAYLVNVPKAGNYAFSLVMYDGSSTPDGSIALDVDQKPVGSFTVTQTPAGTPQTVGPVNVTLTSGLHLIEILQAGTYNFSASSIMVTAG